MNENSIQAKAFVANENQKITNQQAKHIMNTKNETEKSLYIQKSLILVLESNSKMTE